MPKSSKKQIERDEATVLEEIQKNANKSINEIAQKCGFSRQKVWRIIKRLEKNNIIWGYITVIDEEKKGLKSFIILIKRTNKPLDKTLVENIIDRKIETYAEKLGINIDTSLYLNGVYDWLICFTAEDIKQAKKFVEILNRIYHGYIQETQLLEKMFPIKRCCIENPNPNDLKQYADV